MQPLVLELVKIFLHSIAFCSVDVTLDIIRDELTVFLHASVCRTLEEF